MFSHNEDNGEYSLEINIEENDEEENDEVSCEGCPECETCSKCKDKEGNEQQVNLYISGNKDIDSKTIQEIMDNVVSRMSKSGAM